MGDILWPQTTLGQKHGVKTECGMCYMCDAYEGDPRTEGFMLRPGAPGVVLVQIPTLVADSQLGAK